MNIENLKAQAREVLEHNDSGDWTNPSPDVYPHQWLWDSCFAAMGWAEIDLQRAKRELYSLVRGQWRNGMLPHMIFDTGNNGSKHLPSMWESRLSPYAPPNLATSGITQPPMLAEAMFAIGSKLNPNERQQFYKKLLPHLFAYHSWLYEERDLHSAGLVTLIHPWETGMDNTPPWIEAMHKHSKPNWIRLIEITRLDRLIEHIRRDTRQIPIDERASTIESLMLYHIARRLRRKNYDTDRIMQHSHFLIEDLFFNSILVRANHLLVKIAGEARASVPNNLLSSINRSKLALDQLWDDDQEQYFSRYFVTREPIKEQSLATLMPLYAGAISKSRAEILVELFHRHDMFGANFPVPSVPLSSNYFQHRRYWQGPVWLNTNWLIYDGLKRYGYKDEAALVRRKSLQLVEKSGFHEYFSPVDGYGAGVQPFSWTAAVVLLLLAEQQPL